MPTFPALFGSASEARVFEDQRCLGLPSVALTEVCHLGVAKIELVLFIGEDALGSREKDSTVRTEDCPKRPSLVLPRPSLFLHSSVAVRVSCRRDREKHQDSVSNAPRPPLTVPCGSSCVKTIIITQ